ncbi:hypothetical protein [Simkania sp.]|uniref:hypothetical protein n=1 Tax=Simkania sp. TaxID=34094 RepID=UPI003B5249AD
MKIDWKNISLKDLAGYLSEELRKEGIDLILVGGACVTIYSKNRYQSYDLDFITYEDLRKVKKALSKFGFEYNSRYFIRQDCPWIIEFVSPPIAVGNEPIHHFSNVKTKMGTIKMLRPIDSIKDRLASFYHWDDRQGLKQALDICREVQDIDFGELEKWSKAEGFTDKYQEFLNHYQQTSAL